MTATRRRRGSPHGGTDKLPKCKYEISAVDDDEDYGGLLDGEEDLKVIGNLSCSKESPGQEEWTATNFRTRKVFRFRLSSNGILDRTLAVYEASERIGTFSVQKHVSDVFRLRLTWKVGINCTNDTELVFILLCFHVIHAE